MLEKTVKISYVLLSTEKTLRKTIKQDKEQYKIFFVISLCCFVLL